MKLASSGERFSAAVRNLLPWDVKVPKVVDDIGDGDSYGMQTFTTKLASSGVIFCNFGDVYKVTPDIFRMWMAILRRVPRYT